MSAPNLDPFVRKKAAHEVHGGGVSKFHQDMREGRFPKPDAYLSDRLPVWLTSTLHKWQQDMMAAQKPAPFRVRRKAR